MKKNINENQVSNGAKSLIDLQAPYHVKVKIQGSSDYLYHRWNCESVREKANAPKNSKLKKTDDIETFVYRNEEGYLCIPGEQLRMSIIGAAKYRQDPRSPRKSAQDLYKAGFVMLTNLASTGLKEWDYEDQRRVVIQRNSISRIRPALKAGWTSEFDILVNLPEYISAVDMHDMIINAGKLCGVGTFRPTYGRFQVINFEAY